MERGQAAMAAGNAGDAVNPLNFMNQTIEQLSIF